MPLFDMRSFLLFLFRAKQAGAEVSDELVIGTTTHVIAARDLNAEEIARKLEKVPNHAAVKCYEVKSATSALPFKHGDCDCTSCLIPRGGRLV